MPQNVLAVLSIALVLILIPSRVSAFDHELVKTRRFMHGCSCPPPSPPNPPPPPPPPPVCPSRYYCPVTPTSYIACPAGRYCPTGSTQPTMCPGGYYCPSLSAAATSCPAGTYCPAGSASTSSCPAGSFCPLRSSAPTACIGGTYCPASSGAATACPAGSYCPAKSGSPTPCPAGSFCPLRSSAASVCSGGTYCPAGSSTATTCPAGSYCPVRSGSPTTCPAGSYCPQGAAAGTTCPPGSYCPLGSSSPRTCPAGNYCPPGSGAPVRCPGGSFCAPAVSLPTACSAGTFCPAGAAVPTMCPAGSFCPASSSAPTTCPIGHYCPPRVGAPVRCQSLGYCMRTGMSLPSFSESLSLALSPSESSSVLLSSSSSCSAGTQTAGVTVSRSSSAALSATKSVSTTVSSTVAQSNTASRSQDTTTASFSGAASATVATLTMSPPSPSPSPTATPSAFSNTSQDTVSSSLPTPSLSSTPTTSPTPTVSVSDSRCVQNLTCIVSPMSEVEIFQLNRHAIAINSSAGAAVLIHPQNNNSLRAQTAVRDGLTARSVLWMSLWCDCGVEPTNATLSADDDERGLRGLNVSGVAHTDNMSVFLVALATADGSPVLSSSVSMFRQATLRMDLVLMNVLGRHTRLNIVVAVPPLVFPDLSAAAAAAVHSAQVASLVGTANAASMIGRLAVSRALMMCDGSSGGSGGLLMLSIGPEPYSDDVGAIIGNIVILIVVAATLLSVAAVYAVRRHCRPAASLGRVALPSSLLQSWLATTPTTTAAFAGIFAVAQPSAFPILCAIVGVTVVALPFLCLTRVPHFVTHILRMRPQEVVFRGGVNNNNNKEMASNADATEGGVAPRSPWKRLIYFVRLWTWRSVEWRPVADILTRSSEAASAGALSIILDDHRLLWYPVLESSVLVAGSLFAGISATISNLYVCRSVSVLVCILFIGQFVLILIRHPFTTIMTQATTLTMQLLMIASCFFQCVFLFANNGDDEQVTWPVTVSSVCDLMFTAVAFVRFVVLDIPQFVRGTVRIVTEIIEGRDKKTSSSASLDSSDAFSAMYGATLQSASLGLYGLNTEEDFALPLSDPLSLHQEKRHPQEHYSGELCRATNWGGGDEDDDLPEVTLDGSSICETEDIPVDVDLDGTGFEDGDSSTYDLNSQRGGVGFDTLRMMYGDMEDTAYDY